MSVFFAVLTQNILPIMLVASFGYLLRRRLDLQANTLTSVVFNVLSPCLVFSSLVSTELRGSELALLAAFSSLMILAMSGLALALARLLRLGRAETATLLIVAMFVNGGNYGLTLLQLRYGDDGLARGVVFYVTSTLLLYTLGVFIASMGLRGWRPALQSVVRLPAVHAAVLALLVYELRIPIPTPIMRGISVAGSGAIPVMLLILGMQIADLRRGETTRYVWPAVGLRLVVGPVVAVAVAALVGLTGLDRATMIIQGSMPPAVFALILVSQFGLPTPAAARIVVFSTLISPLTIAATITLLSL